MSRKRPFLLCEGSPLLDLPNELLTSIIEHIEDGSALHSLALTCSFLHHLTEPFFYRWIFLRTGRQAIGLSEAFKYCPERAEAIQKIDLRCHWRQERGISSLVSVIIKAKNLRELTIESPYCHHPYGDNIGEWQRAMYELLRPLYEFNTLEGSIINQLPRLTKCERSL